MKSLGFKGSGFNYLMETDNFVFTVGLQASRYGKQCCAEFGIHPKEIERLGDHRLDFKNMKYYSCELRSRLAKHGMGDQWWYYSDDQEKNIQIGNDIFESVLIHALPVFKQFTNDPNILDKIEITDFDNLYKNIPKKLAGMTLMTSEVRFAWALTKIFEKKNPTKARQFAKYGLSKLEATNLFFGRKDFEKVLTQNNDA